MKPHEKPKVGLYLPEGTRAYDGGKFHYILRDIGDECDYGLSKMPKCSVCGSRAYHYWEREDEKKRKTIICTECVVYNFD